MKIVFFGKGNRAVRCLQALHDNGRTPDLVVGQPSATPQWYASVSKLAADIGIETIEPEDPNSPDVENALREKNADLFILGGYGKIVKNNIINLPKIMCINLHGGQLPKYRGSSALNWALINGDDSFTLSIIKVDAGVDTGDVILDRSFPITIESTIKDLHDKAEEQFPLMLIEAVEQIANGTFKLRKQNQADASYYPLRFPEDGLILWDMYSAEQVYNRVRALTEPYPCATTFFNSRKVRLLEAKYHTYDFFGEAGRIYIKDDRGLLVCAKDKSLWIRRAVFEDDGSPLFDAVKRYESLATIRGMAAHIYNSRG